MFRGVLTAIFITTSVCNLKYCVHTNIGVVSACTTYTFDKLCLWSMFIETLMCEIQHPQTAQENELVDTTTLSAHINYLPIFC
jgi:hypothetical protein